MTRAVLGRRLGARGPSRRPPPQGGAQPLVAARTGSLRTAGLLGLVAQLVAVLLGQRGAQGRVLHGDPPFVWAALSRTVGVRPSSTPQVKTLILAADVLY